MYELHMPLIYHELSHHSLKLHLACLICMIKFSGINQASSVHTNHFDFEKSMLSKYSLSSFKLCSKVSYFSVIFMLVNVNIKSGSICIFQAKYFSFYVHLIYMTLCTYIELSLKGYRILLCKSISNTSQCSKNKSDTMMIIDLESCG